MQAILTINAGSSTIKFAVFSIVDKAVTKIYSGIVDQITTNPHLKIKDINCVVVGEEVINLVDNKYNHYEKAIYLILEYMQKLGIEVIAAGHRVIHGAMQYRTALVATPVILKFLEKFNPLAPLHQPYNLNGINILTAKFPNISQVVCFDTAFHTTCNELTQLFAIPKWLTEEGVRRYGFHGLSYEYIATQLDKYLPAGKASGKIIVMHLGQGASMCGMINHKSYTTSLSFSALDGLPMGTRTGSFDPGAMLYLMEHYKMDHKQLEHLLYKESGLLGVSGESSDMRVLLSSNKPDSKLAIALFVYRVGAWIGTLAAEMQGIDGLVFTAGIGENAAQIREKVCERASWLGAKIDSEKNVAGNYDIAHHTSKLSINIIPTDEELMIAQHTLRLAVL